MEHHKADVRQVAGRGAAGDDTTRFLRELRQLRDGAGLGHAELAARAHYPYDTIKAAEVGPTLPDLPVLSAYVRGCGGTAEEWEERWRRLTRTPSLPVPASRHAGNSAAATAGARIGAATQVVDSPDPSVIMAALNRVAEGMAVGDPDLDTAPLTVPPRPAYPADDAPAVSSPTAVSPADMSPADMSPADMSRVDVPLADAPFGDVSFGDVSQADAPFGDVSFGDVSQADPPFGDVSFGDVSQADSPFGDVSFGDVSQADAPFGDVSFGDVSQADAPFGDVSLDDLSLGDVSMPDVVVADAFAASTADNPGTDSADFPPFTPFTPVPQAADPLVIPADDPLVTPVDALAADATAEPAQLAADDRPKGWDPIRVSAAWPKIGDEDPRVARASGDAAAMDTAAPAEGLSAGWARPGKSAPAKSGTQPAIRQSAWARGVDAVGEPTSVARPGSRARTLMVAVVLVCVLAVVLAIFA